MTKAPARRYVRETAPAKALSAFVITRGARYVATVQMHHAAACLVNVWQAPAAYAASYRAANGLKRNAPLDDRAAFDAFHFQQGKASGYGYDKQTAALAGLIIDGHLISDHCSRHDAPAAPKGSPAGLYPSEYKAPKGFKTSNWSLVSAATGRKIWSDDWKNRAQAQLAIADHDVITQWPAIADLARALRAEWESSPDCVRGWTDLYREPGLSYLTALGYTVHNAI